jgi:hypothetical protein
MDQLTHAFVKKFQVDLAVNDHPPADLPKVTLPTQLAVIDR